MKSIKLVVKLIIFIALFFVLSSGVAFILKDDTNSYSRALFNEFYQQDNIDILFCGASHVSHGVDCRISDVEFGANTFNTGTPSQGINGTYAIIQQAIKNNKISKIYLECDFAITCWVGEMHSGMGKSDFIVSNFLRDSSIKNQFIFENSSPASYLNAVLPIGKDKMMTVNPKKIAKKIKMILNGEYFNYSYGSADSGYAGKGCVLDYEKIENGTFSYDKFEPSFKPVSEYWKLYVGRIIELCNSNNIELIFFSMPGSDFYLHEKGDYDVFYSELKDYLNNLGFEYYDFNLCKPEFSMEDEHYSDDNHLNADGIERFSHVFCDFFTGKVSRQEMFYDSYREKCEDHGPSIYGLLVIKSEDGASFEIIPIKNNFPENMITYDVNIINESGISELAEHSSETHYKLPRGTNGTINVKAYIDDRLTNNVKENYAAF